MEVAIFEPAHELFFIKKTCGTFLVAEKEPVFPGSADGSAFLQKGAERCDASAGPNHDDGRLALRRQLESLRWIKTYT